MSRLGVEHDIAELAIGHKRTGLDRLYNFDQAWQLRCDAFARGSADIAALNRRVRRCRGGRYALPSEARKNVAP